MSYRYILAALSVAALVSCTDLSLAPERSPTTLRLDEDTVTVFAGDAVTVGVTVLDGGGTPFEDLPRWATPTWSSSDPARVAPLGEALEALAPGEATATATLAGLTGRATVRVNPHELDLDVRAVYLNQSIQRLDGSVPLVEGRDALLRVFLTGDQPAFFRPAVLATLHRDGSVLQAFEMDRDRTGIPQQVGEEDLGESWNVLVPGHLIMPGVSLVIEADPHGAVPLMAGSQTRYPESGSLALDIRAVPPLWLRLVPVHENASGGTGNADRPEVLTRPTVAQFPVSEMDVDVRATYFTDAHLDTRAGWSELLSEIAALRTADESGRYYYGVVRRPTPRPGESTPAGLGYLGWPAAIGYDAMPRAAATLAHELGHNFGLPHAPCGGPANTDPAFPYLDGGIGVFGYDLLNGRVKHPAVQKDLMTYCDPSWISDYNYVNVLDNREEWDWTTTGPDGVPARADALLVWGGVRDGGLVLEPAFELVMTPVLPEDAGVYRIEGYDEQDAPLFSYAFQGQAMDHHPGDRSFAFAIPNSIAQPARLARLRLVGPEGEVTRHRSSAVSEPVVSTRKGARDVTLAWDGREHPMALVRDAATGRVISFARNGQMRLRGTLQDLEVVLSDGVRTVQPEIRVR